MALGTGLLFVGGGGHAVVVAEADDKKIPALQVILKSLEDKGIPRILFLNKMDKTSASVRGTLEMLQPASAVPLVLRHIPIRQNDVVTGFIDLALERAFVYREHAASELIDMTDADRAREAEARYSMLETLADYDDGLMEQLLEDIQPDRDQIFKDLAVEMREGQICPVLIGSAEGANGIGRLLKAIRHETRGVEETRLRLGVENTGDGIVQVLKTLHTTHGGKLSIVRVLAGEIGDGTEFTGPSGPVGRVSGVFRIIGQQANKRDTASAGETVGLGKLDDALTGQTLSTAKEAPPQVVALAAPQPVLGTAVSTAVATSVARGPGGRACARGADAPRRALSGSASPFSRALASCAPRSPSRPARERCGAPRGDGAGVGRGAARNGCGDPRARA